MVINCYLHISGCKATLLQSDVILLLVTSKEIVGSSVAKHSRILPTSRNRGKLKCLPEAELSQRQGNCSVSVTAPKYHRGYMGLCCFGGFWVYLYEILHLRTK